MGPPKSSGKRPSSSDAGSVQSSPTTPASAPGTPLPDQAPAKRAKVKKATEQTVLTPLQKAKDMCTKLLKKKSDASNLGLTLQSVAYADALSAEMTQFAKKFEFLGNKSFFSKFSYTHGAPVACTLHGFQFALLGNVHDLIVQRIPEGALFEDPSHDQ